MEGYRFRRFVNGQERAEGVHIESAETLTEAMNKAVDIVRRENLCPHGVSTVLMLEHDRTAELEAENARLQNALRSVTSVCRILSSTLRHQAEEVSDLHEIATTALRSTTQKEARDAG